MSVNNVPLGTPLSAIEAALEYGGDYQLSPTGDLLTVLDTPYSPDATIQRVKFMIFTNPAIQNVTATAIAEPDDMFASGYGAGARAYVGRANAKPNTDAIKRNILAGLAAMAEIAQSPAPIVNVTFGSDAYSSQVFYSVEFYTVTGQLVTIPDSPITGALAA